LTSPTSHTRRLTGFVTAALLVGVAVLGAACSSDSTTTPPSSTSTEAPSPTSVLNTNAEGITALGAWARTSPMSATTGAAYMELVGGPTDDELVGASVASTIAGSVELHETSMAGGDMDDMGDSMGMMTMRQVPSIAVPAEQTVALTPGGLHLMLIELAKPLEAGEVFDLTLSFASGEQLVVPTEVRAG